MLKAAVLRRHLNDDQRAAMCVQYMQANPAPEGKASPNYAQANSPERAGELGNGHPAQTEAMQTLNVRSRFKVDKANYIQSRNPELFGQVHAGDKKLNEAFKDGSN